VLFGAIRTVKIIMWMVNLKYPGDFVILFRSWEMCGVCEEIWTPILDGWRRRLHHTKCISVLDI
jgi:hypothetical protein